MSDVSKWGKLSALNKDTSPDGAQDGWTGSAVGPWARETMAGVARWYSDTAFTSPLFDMDSTNDTKSIGVTGADITITAFTSDPSVHFPEGRMLKITDPGGSTAVGFIASSVFAGTTITVTMDYITAPPANGSSPLADNVQFAVMGEDTGPGNFAKATNALGGQLIGPTVLSGGGTTAMRDAKFATVATTPDGILWYNTTLRQLQVTESGAWVTTDVGGLESESLTLKVNGDTKAQLYRDGTDKTVLQNSVEPWADGVAATKSRIYLSDADQVLYYQTKALSTEETALAILTGLYTEDTAPGTTNFSTSGSWWFKIPVLGLLILGGQHSITAYGTITTVTYSTQHPGAPAFTAQPTLVTTMRGSTSGASLNESMETFERKLASFQCRPAHSGGHSGAFDYIAIGKYSA